MWQLSHNLADIKNVTVSSENVMFITKWDRLKCESIIYHAFKKLIEVVFISNNRLTNWDWPFSIAFFRRHFFCCNSCTLQKSGRQISKISYQPSL